MQPILQIRQTPALLGMDTEPGQYSIRQPKADLEITTHQGEAEIYQYAPELTVDQSRAREAFTGGNFITMNQRIYSGIQQIFLQNIASRVDQGNQLAQFYKPGHSIANIIGSDWQGRPFPEFRGPASMKNVDIRFEQRAPEFNIQQTKVDVQVQVNKPEIEYNRGRLNIYMRQYSSVEFIPPEVDLQW